VAEKGRLARKNSGAAEKNPDGSETQTAPRLHYGVGVDPYDEKTKKAPRPKVKNRRSCTLFYALDFFTMGRTRGVVCGSRRIAEPTNKSKTEHDSTGSTRRKPMIVLRMHGSYQLLVVRE